MEDVVVFLIWITMNQQKTVLFEKKILVASAA